VGRRMSSNNPIHFCVLETSHPELRGLIVHSINSPTDKKIEEVLKGYRAENHVILGCLLGARLVGVMSIEKQLDLKYSIKHIAILPEHRLQGIGRQFVDEVMQRFQVNKLVAETDDTTVGFYRAIGFHCDLKEKDSHHYLCTLSHDKILLEIYNPQWPKMAQDEMDFLRSLLPSAHILDIQHVGSTAIPGMIAKPVIDIQIAVDSLVAAQHFAINILESHGYVYWYNNPDKERMLFVKGMPPYGERRTHHVHICELSCNQWQNKILFRDFLIAHPLIAKEYMALKTESAEKHTYDREKYTDAKKLFVEEVLNIANGGKID